MDDASHGGSRRGAGRPSAFPRGSRLIRRSVRMPQDFWDRLDALARSWDTTDDGAIAKMLDEQR